MRELKMKGYNESDPIIAQLQLTDRVGQIATDDRSLFQPVGKKG
jgi:hypothetical protein